MDMGRDRTRQGQPVEHWLLLGASGVLQPLSEEFMYCASAKPAGHTWQRQVQPTGSRRRGTD